MEFCSVEDAFPQLGPSNIGCKDDVGSSNAKKQERKKAKKCRGPALTFLDLDPDRPAYQKGPDVPPMNTATGLREHAPVDAPQPEGFQNQVDANSVPYDLTSQRVPNDAQFRANNTLPNVGGQNQLPGKTPTVPSYFGKGLEDTSEGFQDKTNSGPAPFTDVIGEDASYRLYPDFKQAFDRIPGLGKAGGSPYTPVPSVVDQWKPLTPSGARTSFFDELPPPGGETVKQDWAPTEQSTMVKKLDQLFARLDDLETRRGENTQTEILLFVMSGLFVLFSMNIVSQQAMRFR
jgi:hypothetical protein